MKQKCCGYGIDTFSNDALRYLPTGKIKETAIASEIIRARELALREKCSNTEFNLVQMWENKDQKKFLILTFFTQCSCTTK